MASRYMVKVRKKRPEDCCYSRPREQKVQKNVRKVSNNRKSDFSFELNLDTVPISIPTFKERPPESPPRASSSTPEISTGGSLDQNDPVPAPKISKLRMNLFAPRSGPKKPKEPKEPQQSTEPGEVSSRKPLARHRQVQLGVKTQPPSSQKVKEPEPMEPEPVEPEPVEPEPVEPEPVEPEPEPVALEAQAPMTQPQIYQQSPRKKTLTPQQQALFQGNSMRPRKRVLGVNKRVLGQDAPASQGPHKGPGRGPRPEPVRTVDQMIDGNSDLVQDCISVIIQCDPDQKCSKDELIARIEYQKNQLLKRNEGIKTKKIIAMEKILHDLRDEQMREGMASMALTRTAQNKIVLENQMEENIYKQKIDLTLPENKRKLGDDPNCVLFKNGKGWWRIESKKKHKTPIKLEAAFKKNRGNKKLPKELARKMPGY